MPQYACKHSLKCLERLYYSTDNGQDECHY